MSDGTARAACSESYQDVADRLAIFLRSLKRRSTIRQMMIEDSGQGLDPDE